MTGLTKHVVCAISGGVDSAVAAYLLKKSGYRVTGCFMKNWNRQEELFNNCDAEKDESDAEYVCNKLNIPLISVDFSKSYWNQVFSNFLTEYEQGMTPNPDILCNRKIKFPMLFKYCEENLNGFDYIATGHYSRLRFDPDLKKFRLLKSVDELKDQSFFLSQVDSRLFDRILFPVGDCLKKDVRFIAQQIGLNRVARKKSSIGICFIGKRKFFDFIDEYLPPKYGPIVDLDTGVSLGEHSGFHHYTVGQRIVIKDELNVKKKAYYVARKDINSNSIFAVSDTNHPALYFDEFEIEKPYWICEEKGNNDNGIILDESYEFKFQNRHIQTPLVYFRKDGSETNARYWVKTKNYFRAIVTGQYSVFYKQDECIGSAKIISTPISLHDRGIKGPLINSDTTLVKNYTNRKPSIKNNEK